MKIKIIVGFCIVALLLFLMFAKTTESYVKAEEVKVEVIEVTDKPKVVSVPDIIEEIAPRFGQDPKLIKKIVWCESKFKNVSHDNGHGKGVTGIHKKTFDLWLPRYEKEEGETLNYASSYDQIKLMSWAFKKGYQRQWTSYRAYINGGTYAFHSILLNKDFVVKCK